mgnify:CR=1 FL=1
MSKQLGELLIEGKNVVKDFPLNSNSIKQSKMRAINDVSFKMYKSRGLSVVGESGSGKSTLLGLLAGLDQVTEGEIYLDDEPLHKLDEEARARMRGDKVGFIFQSFMLVQSLTALENVMLPAEISGMPRPRQAALEALKQVGLDHRASHYPNQLLVF